MSDPDLELDAPEETTGILSLPALLAIAHQAPTKFPLTPRQGFLSGIFLKTFTPHVVSGLIERLIEAENEVERLECIIEGVPSDD